MVEAAFATHFPIPPIYPYLPFTLAEEQLNSYVQQVQNCNNYKPDLPSEEHMHCIII